MHLEAGVQLGAFEINSLLGEGGMGKVYRARDTRLGRDVAIKVLPEHLAKESGYIARFQREARILASLDHPNIGTIHEVGEVDGTHFLVLQLIEGDTLSDRIRQGPLPLSEALPIFQQIAGALDAAHAAGIVHRDLKPSNVKICPDGCVKVLDFGIAKSVQEQSVDSNAPTRPMEPQTLTADGTTVGTPQYMSPEQVRGSGIDRRSDVWAFGCCLYEALAGVRPYQGDTATDVVAAILEREPDWTKLSRLPQEVTKLLRRCLEKDPNWRYSSMHDIAILLEEAQPRSGPAAMHRAAFAAGLATMLVLFAILGVTMRSDRPPDAISVAEPQPARQPAVADQPEIASVAVLPLENLMGDPAQEYFVGAMAEYITIELSKVAALKVTSRTSAMQFKDSVLSVPDIAEKLGVDAVVEGAVLREEDRVRIAVRLVHAATDTMIWSDSFTSPITSVQQTHADVALAIADAIHVKVTGEERARIAHVQRVDPDAYDAYLLGHHFLNDITPDGLRQAVSYFEQAADIDPDFAHAWGGMVCAYVEYPFFGVGPPREAFPKARSAGLRALSIDYDQSTDQSHLGIVSMAYDWEWEEAEYQFRRAMELSPNDPVPHVDFAIMSAVLGRNQEAQRHLLIADDLDPFPSHLFTWVSRALLRLETDPETVASDLEQLIEERPDWLQALQPLTLAYLSLNDDERALATAETWAVKANRDAASLTNLALLHAYLDQDNQARDLLLEVEDKDEYFDAAAVAYVYVTLSDLDTAFQWLERAVEQRDWNLVLIRSMPYRRLYREHAHWVAFRKDPRYAELILEMGFPPFPSEHPWYDQDPVRNAKASPGC